MLTPRQRFGNEGEALAAAFLRSKGCRILARQVRVGRWGELDLVAERRGMLVFVEVKTRHDAAFGTPEESVTPAKLEKLTRAIEAFRHERGLERVPYRLDVVAVDMAGGGAPRIRHYESVGA